MRNVTVAMHEQQIANINHVRGLLQIHPQHGQIQGAISTSYAVRWLLTVGLENVNEALGLEEETGSPTPEKKDQGPPTGTSVFDQY